MSWTLEPSVISHQLFEVSEKLLYPYSHGLTLVNAPFPYPYTLLISVFLTHIRTPYPIPNALLVSVCLTCICIPHPYPYTSPVSPYLTLIRMIPTGLAQEGPLALVLCILSEWICVHGDHAHNALCVSWVHGGIGGKHVCAV